MFPKVKLIISKENLGFSGGNNLGIKYALKQNPDYILLLNNDTAVDKNFLTELTKVAEKNSNAGVLMPKIYYYVSLIIPPRYFITIIKSIMIKGTGFLFIWKETLIILSMTLLFIGLSVKKFKVRLK